MMKKRSEGSDSARKAPYDAVVIIGKVKDSDALNPNWHYPFSKAEGAAVKALKRRGYQRIVTFREPESSYLRRILAKSTLKAVYFIGHGRIYGARHLFQLNEHEEITGMDLRAWAYEDVILPSLSGEIVAKLDADPPIEFRLQQVSSYNFDLSVVHSCHSMRDPELRRSLGGEYEGNPWYHPVRIPPFLSHRQHTVDVDIEAFLRNPHMALQGALVQALAELGPGMGEAIAGDTVNLDKLDSLDPSVSSRRTTLCDALWRLIEAIRRDENVISAVRQKVNLKLVAGSGEYPVLSLDELAAKLRLYQRGYPPIVCECGMPTTSSGGELNCRRRVRGGGPCYQHEHFLDISKIEPGER
jgi:hypothetical protein